MSETDKRNPLHGAYLKAARAAEHLRGLSEETQAWIDRGPFTTPSTIDTEGWQVIHLSVKEPAPLRLGVIVGDVLHNARSALDHTAWELVLRAGGNPGRHTGFPLFTVKADWIASVISPSEGRRSPLEGVSDEAFDLVEKLQPLHDGARDVAEQNPLALLKWANDRDKHRTLHIAYTFLSDAGDEKPSIGVTFSRPEIITKMESETDLRAGQRLEDGMRLGRIRVYERADVEYLPGDEGVLNIPIGVLFGQDERFISYRDLSAMVDAVIETIGKFDLRFFEKLT